MLFVSHSVQHPNVWHVAVFGHRMHVGFFCFFSQSACCYVRLFLGYMIPKEGEQAGNTETLETSTLQYLFQSHRGETTNIGSSCSRRLILYLTQSSGHCTNSSFGTLLRIPMTRPIMAPQNPIGIDCRGFHCHTIVPCIAEWMVMIVKLLCCRHQTLHSCLLMWNQTARRI